MAYVALDSIPQSPESQTGVHIGGIFGCRPFRFWEARQLLIRERKAGPTLLFTGIKAILLTLSEGANAGRAGPILPAGLRCGGRGAARKSAALRINISPVARPIAGEHLNDCFRGTSGRVGDVVRTAIRDPFQTHLVYKHHEQLGLD